MSILVPSKCRHCGEKFLPPAEPMVLNDPRPEWAKFCQTLTTHLAKKHKRELTFADFQGREYAFVLIALNYEISDPEMQKFCDFARWKVHNVTTRARVSDERIKERVERMLDEEMEDPANDEETTTRISLSNAIAKLLSEMRDVIEERDLYPAPTAAQNGNLAPNPDPS